MPLPLEISKPEMATDVVHQIDGVTKNNSIISSVEKLKIQIHLMMD